MTIKVLVSAPYMQPIINTIRPIFQSKNIELIVPTVNERLEEADLLQIIGDIDGVMCGDDRFTDRVLRAAAKLKVISKWGTGIDSIDRETCDKLGIVLCNTPNAFSEPVADSVLAYMLCFARQIPWMTEDMRNGIWKKIPGFTLREATLGVIGVGNVGKAVIQRALSFGMNVLGNDTAAICPDYITLTGISSVSLDKLLRESDIISINCDLNPTSRYLLNKEKFKLVKNTAFLINTARGPIIHETSLIETLEEGRLAGAGLDVFEEEPLPANSPLRTMSNVLLAPHNSNSSPAAWERVHINTIQNLFSVLGISNDVDLQTVLQERVCLGR
ncbi:MAG: dihydrofolate reductase [Deltaproteobacteria bacterium]|nr:dihydrofolate reductase [Deltaproteobacteria bacterium]TLN04790.1 MAG: dihydrofolate reductase [bacterium]